MMRHPSLLLRATALAFGLLSSACAAAAQPAAPFPPPVVLDGLFDEWAETPFAAVNGPRRGPVGQNPWGADSLAHYARPNGVAVRHDAEAVYLLLRLETEVSLQALAGTLLLLLDADGDPASGWEEHGMRGVDAVIEFSPATNGWRSGIGLRMADSAGALRLRMANEAGVIVAPTHAARVFELRIRRGGPVAFGERMTARVVALDRDGGVVDALSPFTADLSNPRPRPTPPGAGEADPLARAPGTDFRVVSWNVGREDLFQQPEAFGAILRALAPDLLMLDEVAGGHSAEEVEVLLNRVDPGERPWRAVYGVSGGTQRGVIATRGPAPRAVAPFDRVIPYPEQMPALLPSGAPAAAHRAAQQRLVDGVPAFGAIAEVDGRRLLAVTLDLESGGGPDSPADRLRRMEAQAIRDAAEEAAFTSIRPEGVDGILVAGDLNVVGTREPLRILSAAAADGSPFAVAQPLRLDGMSATTWDWPTDRFTPGRLDYVVYHPELTAVTGGFVFSSADLSPEWRARHGLRAETSRATDHLPVVTDLRWVELDG